MNNEYTRVEMLIGEKNLSLLKDKKVIVFGCGGVGGHCIEALARSGILNISVVDGDVFDITNFNRQLLATRKYLNKPKVEAAYQRIKDINPLIEVKMFNEFYNEETKDTFELFEYDYIVDAIDDVKGKLLLVEQANYYGVKIISSMGAGNKLDPTGFKVMDIYQTNYDKLAKVIRQRLRKMGINKLKVVSSNEQPRKPFVDNQGKIINGTVSFVPGVVGMIIAGEVIKDLFEVRI